MKLKKCVFCKKEHEIIIRFICTERCLTKDYCPDCMLKFEPILIDERYHRGSVFFQKDGDYVRSRYYNSYNSSGVKL